MERKMVQSLKERSTRSLVSLTLLLDDTFDAMLALLEDLNRAQLVSIQCMITHTRVERSSGEAYHYPLRDIDT